MTSSRKISRPRSAPLHESDLNPWTICKKNTVYENPWIKVDHHEVIDPKGLPGIYGTVHYKHTAIGIVPLSDEHETWLVGQYRFPLNTYSWEIPEGGAHKSETPLEAAKRELREETGLLAKNFEYIMEMHLSNSTSDEKALVYIAHGLTEGPSAPESTEDLQIKKIPFAKALEMVLAGEITDAISVAALLKTAHLLSSGSLLIKKAT